MTGPMRSYERELREGMDAVRGIVAALYILGALAIVLGSLTALLWLVAYLFGAEWAVVVGFAGLIGLYKSMVEEQS